MPVPAPASTNNAFHKKNVAAAPGDDEQPQPWWRNKKRLLVVLGVVTIALVILVGIVVGLSTRNKSSSSDSDDVASSPLGNNNKDKTDKDVTEPSPTSPGTLPMPPALDGETAAASLYAVYEVSWEDSNTCQGTSTPPLHLSCGILETKHEDCSPTSTSSADCMANPVQVACSGEQLSDLLLTASLDESSYICSTQISCTNDVFQQSCRYGGSVEKSLQVRQIVSPNNKESTDIQCLNGVVQTKCQETDSCDADQRCPHTYLGAGDGCTGENQCSVALGRVQAKVVSSTENFSPSTKVAADERCLWNSQCTTGICILGTCRTSLLLASETCENSGQCQNQACGEYGPNVEKICCPSGGTSEHGKCTEQPVDSPCTQDVICASSLCVSGQCVAERQEDGSVCGADHHCLGKLCILGTCRDSRQANLQACGEDDDCSSGSCAYYGNTSNQKVCCPSGNKVFQGTTAYCTNQPQESFCPQGNSDICESNICIMDYCRNGKLSAEEACSQDADCQSGACAVYNGRRACCATSQTMIYEGQRQCKLNAGQICPEYDASDLCQTGVCARETWVIGSSHVCCTSGSSKYVKPPKGDPEVYYMADFCTGVPAGSECPENDLCANNVCAYDRWQANAKRICCPSGSAVLVGRYGSAGSFGDYCGNQPRNAPCNDNRLCSSGSCVNGSCR